MACAFSKGRSDLLWAWAHLIDQHKEDLARLMTLEQGKPLAESRGEIDYANSFVKWFAEEGRRSVRRCDSIEQATSAFACYQTSNWCRAAITPWNFPTAMITRKIAPAISSRLHGGCQTR